MTELPADLTGPVEIALARAQDEIPAPDTVPGGYAYDLKWTGSASSWSAAAPGRGCGRAPAPT